MKTVISTLDELWGDGMVSFIRDPTQDAITVSVKKEVLGGPAAQIGWKFVMGSKFCVRTMPEREWGEYVAQAQKGGS